MSASRASGQQITRRMSHSKNFAIVRPPRRLDMGCFYLPYYKYEKNPKKAMQKTPKIAEL
jgi:hypothetical protein